MEKHASGGAITHLASGKRVPGDSVLYSGGRQGAVDGLRLDRAGLDADSRGQTEEEPTAAAIPYEIGVSRYEALARGAIVGDSHGMLKLLVGLEDRKLLGVHVLGTNATEVVHIGQAVMGMGGTVDYLVDTVFNYPTLAESYKVAALDAMNKLQAISTVAASA